MLKHGVPGALWATNLVVGILGTLVCFAASCRKSSVRFHSKTGALVVLFAILALVATFCFEGIENVHRWLSVGPFRLHVASVLLPSVIIALHQIREPGVQWGFTLVITALLAAQPDASQAAAFAIASGFVLRGGRVPTLSLTLLLAALVLVAWSQSDPLKSVPHVEGIVGLTFNLNPLLGLVAVIALTALPLSFLSSALAWKKVQTEQRTGVALGAYFAVVLCTCATGRFPVPMMGYGVSPILGYYIGLIWLVRNQATPELPLNVFARPCPVKDLEAPLSD